MRTSVSQFVATSEIVSPGGIGTDTGWVLDVDGWKYHFNVKNTHSLAVVSDR